MTFGDYNIVVDFNENFFQDIENENQAYWLGFIMADGCVTERSANSKCLEIHLQYADENHLQKWHKEVNAKQKIHRSRRASVKSILFSKKMCNDLGNLGCTPRKTLTLQFPDIKDNLFPHFIRGYFDGDGCLYYNRKSDKYRISFSGTPHFLQKIQQILGTKVKMKSFSKIHIIDIGGRHQVKRILHYMYDNATIYLDRKMEKANALLRI